jgi:Fe-S oxidoreductase
VSRPDISTQIRFRKQQEIEAGAARLREAEKVGAGETAVTILTSCPSCLQGLLRYENDADISADYIVVEMAKAILGPDWMQDYLRAANGGGIERVLL